MYRFITSAIAIALLSACGKKEEPVPVPAPAPPPTPVVAPAPEPIVTPPAPPVADAAPARDDAKPASGTYTIAKGDTLYGIARKHGIKPRDLAAWNNIKNPKRLRPGQTLHLSRN